MSDLVEKVARAIMGVHQNNSTIRPAKFVGAPSYYEDMAEAAVKAMREPTDAMLEAGEDFPGPTGGVIRVNPYGKWQAMIDAALK